MISLLKFMSSALRCAESRLSLLRVFWCLIGLEFRPSSVCAEIEATRVQRFDDLIDGLFAEVGDRVELCLGLGDEIADGLDASSLEAVVGAHAELELLDQDAPLLALQRGLRATADG